MRNIAAVLFIVIAIRPPASAQMRGTAKVVDGDTLAFHIRLYGIDTPESHQRCEKDGACYLCGIEAKRFLEHVVRDHTVICRFTGAMTYGRPVASCDVNGQDIGERMILDGWAVPYERYVKGEQRARYVAAFAAAQQARAGMHAGAFVVPERWRRGERLACER